MPSRFLLKPSGAAGNAALSSGPRTIRAPFLSCGGCAEATAKPSAHTRPEIHKRFIRTPWIAITRNEARTGRAFYARVHRGCYDALARAGDVCNAGYFFSFV